MQATQQTAAEQKAFYDEQGYLVFPQLLDEAELADLRTALADVLQQAADLTEPNKHFIVAPGDDGQEHLIRVHHPISYHRTFYDLVFNPKIVDVVETLIGPNIQLRHTALNMKPPSAFSTWLWHQDYPFFPHSNYDLLAVMVFLDDATPENGCLTVLPGSHKAGPRYHDIPKSGPWRLKEREEIADRSRWLELPVPAGGMELHHCNMLHGSKAGKGDRPRSAIVIWYRAADNLELCGPEDHFGYGLQVRGIDPGVVRMVEGVVTMPYRPGGPPEQDGA
jgi:phytanoyl-CoA hydroxylase